MRMANEIKAGIVIIAGIAVGAMFFFKTVDFDTTTYEVKTYFGYAGGLKQDAIVRLSGIEVGRVIGINFVYGEDTRVECVLEITGDAKIRKDSVAYIGTAGFIGDSYVGLTRGESPDFLEQGGVVAGEDPVEMRILMKKADDIADSLKGILGEVKGIVSGNRGNIDNIFKNLENTTQNFEEFSEDIKRHPWKLMFKGE